MIRLVTLLGCFVCLLSACQTPAPVRDMSTLAAKFSAQMDDAVKTYVAALNDNNNSDNARLQNELAETARLTAANADTAAVWRLVSGTRAANVTKTLNMVSTLSAGDSNPITGGGPQSYAASLRTPAKISFDDTPLKTIGDVAGRIAAPKSLSDQLSIMSAYAQTVQSDLKTAGKAPTSPAK
jgi:hypothetical protein